MRKGIIVSVQGYSQETTEELAKEAVNAGAVAIRTDKDIKVNALIVGLKKEKVDILEDEPYITHTLHAVKIVSKWADIIAIDYRRLNGNVKEISDYCREKELKVVADISNMRDYKNIIYKGYYYSFVATTFSVFKRKHHPDKKFIIQIKN